MPYNAPSICQTGSLEIDAQRDVEWNPRTPFIRLPVLPASYRIRELGLDGLWQVPILWLKFSTPQTVVLHENESE